MAFVHSIIFQRDLGVFLSLVSSSSCASDVFQVHRTMRILSTLQRVDAVMLVLCVVHRGPGQHRFCGSHSLVTM
jgi:hypothetical protein